MTIIKKTITVTEKQDDWIKSQIESGDFTNESEYIRDLLRRDQTKRAEFSVIQKAIEEGLNSGISDRNLDDIWAQAEEEAQARNE